MNLDIISFQQKVQKYFRNFMMGGGGYLLTISQETLNYPPYPSGGMKFGLPSGQNHFPLYKKEFEHQNCYFLGSEKSQLWQ